MTYDEAREWLELRGGEVSRELTGEDHSAWVVTVFSKEGQLFDGLRAWRRSHPASRASQARVNRLGTCSWSSRVMRATARASEKSVLAIRSATPSTRRKNASRVSSASARASHSVVSSHSGVRMRAPHPPNATRSPERGVAASPRG